MIQLNSELTYNTELPFEEQTNEVRQFILDKINSNFPMEITEPAGITPRVVAQEWYFTGFRIIKFYQYMNPPESDKNGIILSETIKITGV